MQVDERSCSAVRAPMPWRRTTCSPDRAASRSTRLLTAPLRSDHDHHGCHLQHPGALHVLLEVDLLSDMAPAKKVEGLFYLHRAALKRELIGDLWKRKAATAPTAMADVLLSESVIDAVRKEVRWASKYNPEEVIRPELLVK